MLTHVLRLPVTEAGVRAHRHSFGLGVHVSVLMQVIARTGTHQGRSPLTCDNDNLKIRFPAQGTGLPWCDATESANSAAPL